MQADVCGPIYSGTMREMKSSWIKNEASVAGFMRDLLPALADGRIWPVIDKVYAFADLPAARAHMQANAHPGKIAVRMPAA